MREMPVDARMSAPIEIDLCEGCQAFWFDKYESLKLTAGSTLKLMRFIGDHAARSKELKTKDLRCPRCTGRLRFTNDLQRNTRFTYWRCEKDHGRFIRFFEFLREKNFIRQLTAKEIEELRQNIQNVNCSNCGAPVDLAKASACGHCGSPISMLDMKQPEQLLAQLREASEPRPVNLALPLELAAARRHAEISFQGLASGPEWWSDASSSGLVQAGLSAVARWLTKSDG
jgi:DNA-directed RNA polymerase subunit RPC12/RpoP